jgi:glycine cleavage system aminomethyltransferase T
VSKETAFYPRLAELTDDWTELFAYAAPSLVTDVDTEYRAVRETAGLMDFSMLRKVDIEGPGALDFMNTIVGRDLTKIRQGRIAYGALTNEDGKMLDDCTVMHRDPDRVRFCGANDRDAVLFAEKAKGSGLRVREFTDAMPHLCVQGPRSREILQAMTGSDLSGPVFPYYSFREDVEIASIPVFMTRLGYTAELGFELWVERDRALDLWDALMEAGEPEGMKVIGMVALDLLRIEGGFIIGGIEYDETVSPYECGLGRYVALDKGEFHGREGVIRDRDATTLRLTSVELEGGGADASDAPVLIAGQEVGFITQALVSPFRGGITVGFAKVPQDRDVPGTAVQARVGGELIDGQIVRHPVYEPDRKKARES